jgi:NADPH:quinone reductase-like Zn-dependent oxidoreductase
MAQAICSARPTEFPQQQGWDFAGETSAGRRVLGFVAQPWMGIGTLAERITVASALLADLPDGLSWSEGAALPVCSLTAKLLIDGAGVSEGDRVAVTGAAGMVGGFAVELAKARGARVVRAVREADAEEARRLGVEATVGTGDDLGRLLREWAPGGVDACLDTLGLGVAALEGIREGPSDDYRSWVFAPGCTGNRHSGGPGCNPILPPLGGWLAARLRAS